MKTQTPKKLSNWSKTIKVPKKCPTFSRDSIQKAYSEINISKWKNTF
jgi:hypothetical protein